MKIGFSFVDLAMGGAQSMLVQLASELAARGHSLSYYLFARQDSHAHQDQSLVRSLNAAAHPVNRAQDLLNCQVIHLDGFHSLLKKRFYLSHFYRCVETYHSVYSIHRSGPFYPPNRVVVSRDIGRRLNLPARIIYPGVPLPALPQAIDKAFDIAILGRIHPVKQHLLFLKACEQVYRQRGSLAVLIIGGHPFGGPYPQQVDAEINRLQNEGLEITVTGSIAPDEVYIWLFQSRLQMVTSRDEGFGRMAVEALASCVPVIANPVGGLREIVQEGKTGYFAKQDDADSFASIAISLLNDENLREQIGSAGREDAENRFSLAAMVNEYERFYAEIAGQPVAKE